MRSVPTMYNESRLYVERSEGGHIHVQGAILSHSHAYTGLGT